jgi:hypothetical protein
MRVAASAEVIAASRQIIGTSFEVILEPIDESRKKKRAGAAPASTA